MRLVASGRRKGLRVHSGQIRRGRIVEQTGGRRTKRLGRLGYPRIGRIGGVRLNEVVMCGHFGLEQRNGF